MDREKWWDHESFAPELRSRLLDRRMELKEEIEAVDKALAALSPATKLVAGRRLIKRSSSWRNEPEAPFEAPARDARDEPPAIPPLSSGAGAG
jgi:hypothetical protein